MVKTITSLLIAAWLLVMLVCPAWATPAITGVSDTTPYNGQSITITGTDFGTGPTVYKFTDFENGSLSGMNYDSRCVSVSTEQQRPNSTKNVKQGNASGGLEVSTGSTVTTFFASAWRRLPSTRGAIPSGSNQKWFRTEFNEFKIHDFMIMIADSEWTQGTIMLYNENCNATMWGDYNGTQLGNWRFYELYVDKTSGVVQHWYSGELVYDSVWNDMCSFDTNILTFDYYHADMDFVSTDYAYLDDIYLASSRARVILGNSNTWANCTQREIQPHASWSTTSITLNFRQGAFANSATAYLYVIKSDGTVSGGSAVTISGSSPSTPTIRNGGFRNGGI